MTWFRPAEPTLADIIDLNARWRGRQPAIEWAGTVRSWATLAADLARVGSALDGLGVRRGDRVALLMNNGPEMFDAMLGAIYGGAVAVPLNVSVADDGIAKMLADSGATAIIASDEHIARIDGLRAQLPGLAEGRLIAAGDAPDGWHAFDKLVADADAAWRRPALTAADLCNVIYSSGTTGLPKGILHSHGCRAAWAWDMSIALRYHSGARTLLTLGLYSNITWVAMLATMVAGGSLVLLPRFEASETLGTIAANRITHFAMVPIQFQRMLENADFDRHDLSSIAAVMCCGSPLAVELKREIVERLPGDFIELYGLTEGLVTIQDPDEAYDNPASVGRPCPGQDLRILDNDDSLIEDGRPGEIVGLSRLIMDGYLNRDDANEEATWTDSDGRRWLRTGDIGRIDEAGNLYVVDRKKDMIISGGQNIYPADIEAVIATHDAVREVAVVGIPCERWGETPLAVVVASDLDADQLKAWTNERVGKQQRIAGVAFVDELPRNPNGKILKRELRKRFAAEAAQ